MRVSALCPGFTYSEFHDVTGTRDMVSQLPDYMWLQADEVVRYGLESVQRDTPRVIAVPGRFYRLLVWLAGALPGLGRRLANRHSTQIPENLTCGRPGRAAAGTVDRLRTRRWSCRPPAVSRSGYCCAGQCHRPPPDGGEHVAQVAGDGHFLHRID